MKSFSTQLLFSIALCAIGSNIVASQELALVDSRDRALPLSREILQLCNKAEQDAAIKLLGMKDQIDPLVKIIDEKTGSAETDGLFELISGIFLISEEHLRNVNSILDTLQKKKIELVKMQKKLSEDDPVRKAPLLSEAILGTKKIQKSIVSALEKLQDVHEKLDTASNR